MALERREEEGITYGPLRRTLLNSYSDRESNYLGSNVYWRVVREPLERPLRNGVLMLLQMEL